MGRNAALYARGWFGGCCMMRIVSEARYKEKVGASESNVLTVAMRAKDCKAEEEA